MYKDKNFSLYSSIFQLVPVPPFWRNIFIKLLSSELSRIMSMILIKEKKVVDEWWGWKTFEYNQLINLTGVHAIPQM